MSELGRWAGSWLDRLAREGDPHAHLPVRNAVLHDGIWELITPSQVDEQLRLLHQTMPGADARHGMCAVVYEAPWQGRPALWIDAVAYHHGVARDAVTLVRPRHGRAPVTLVRSGFAAAPPPRAFAAAGLARPVTTPSPAAAPELKAPSFSPRGTFWLWFFLTFLWPLLLVVVVIDFRRAEARDGSGGRYVKAAALGGLTSCALGAAIFAVAWSVFFSTVSGGSLAWQQANATGATAGGTSASPPVAAPDNPASGDPTLSAVLLTTADLPAGSAAQPRVPNPSIGTGVTNISPPSCADLLHRWLSFIDAHYVERDVSYVGHKYTQRVRRAGPDQLEPLREMAQRCPSITYEDQGRTRNLDVQGLPLETDPSIDTVAVSGSNYTMGSTHQPRNHIVLAHHNGVVMSLISNAADGRPDAQITYAITDVALRKLRDNAR